MENHLNLGPPHGLLMILHQLNDRPYHLPQDPGHQKQEDLRVQSIKGRIINITNGTKKTIEVCNSSSIDYLKSCHADEDIKHVARRVKKHNQIQIPP